MESVICRQGGRIGYWEGGVLRDAARLPLHVAVRLSTYERQRAERHTRGTPPNRDERLLSVLRRRAAAGAIVRPTACGKSWAATRQAGNP